MKFPSLPLRLVSIRTIEKEGGKSYTFVRLANTDTFESQDFMLDKSCSPNSLKSGIDYDVELTVEGKFSSVNLSSVG